MIFSRIVSFTVVGTVLLAGGPAVSQYQELPAQEVTTETEAGYFWSVQVSGDEVVLAGDVPYLSVKEMLADRAGAEAVDRMGIAQGAPLGFMRDAAKAIEASALLSQGAVSYSDGAWIVTGALLADVEHAALEALLGERTLAGSPWLIELTEPVERGARDRPEMVAAGQGNETLVVEDVALALTEDADDAAQGVEEHHARAISADEAAVEPEADAMMAEQEAAEPADVIGRGGDRAVEREAAIAPTPDPHYAFSAEIGEDGLVFSGQVPDAGTRLMAGNMMNGLDGVADLAVAEGAPEDFTQTAFAGVAALEHLESGRVALSDGQWRIEGEAAIDTDRLAAIETLERLSELDLWDVAVAAPAAIDICRARVESYMADRAVLFGSGSARLTSDSEAALAGLAEILAICPSTPVYVEGHTDADGGAEDNLILSLSRAEAVVDALVDLGIDPGRLYAVGYGAGLPVASNETAAGKAQNRRIVFSFEDVAETGRGAEL